VEGVKVLFVNTLSMILEQMGQDIANDNLLFKEMDVYQVIQEFEVDKDAKNGDRPE
jgi:hypothetical protein